MQSKTFFARLVVFTVLLCSGSPAFAQTDFWQQTNGPDGGSILAFAINSNGHIFAGTDGAGMFRSTNNGESWDEINFGLTSTKIHVYSLVINSNGHIFAGTPGGVFRSMDNGANWSATGLTNTYVSVLAINSNGDIFAGTFGGVYRSTDNGDSWSLINTGLTNTIVGALAINSSGHIFAGASGDGVFRSTDNGDNWNNTSLDSVDVYSLAINSAGHIFAGTRGQGIFRSRDNGGTWSNVISGAGFVVTSLTINKSSGHIFAGTQGGGGGVLRSTNNGNSWSPVFNIAFTGYNVNSLTINSSGHIFAGTFGGGVYRSIDNGGSWAAVNNGLTNAFVSSLVINATGRIFAGTAAGIFRSTDNGDNWIAVNTGLTRPFINSFAINSSGHIFVGTDFGAFRSTNNGGSWTALNAGFFNFRALAINSSGHIFAGTQGGGVFRSTNNGGRWSAVNTGLTNRNLQSLAINSSGHIFAGTDGGPFRSTDNGASWTAVNAGLTNIGVYSFAINSSGHIFAGTITSGVFRSTDNGDSWAAVNTGLTNISVESLAINSSGHIFVGTFGGGVFRSTNNGDDWTPINSGLTNLDIRSLAINSKGDVFAGTQRSGVFRHLAPPPIVPNLKPEVAASQFIGGEFWVDVALDTVENLFAVSFDLNYTNTNFVDVVTPTSSNVIPGPLLGNDVVFLPNVDESAGKVSIGISRKTGQAGVTGSGVVARVKFTSLISTPAGTSVVFSLSQVTANDPAGAQINLTTRNTTTTIIGVNVWPGDTNNDQIANQADVFPIGLYWNKTGPVRQNASTNWTPQIASPWTPIAATYADANGDSVVNQSDVISIGLNWGKTHASTALSTGDREKPTVSQVTAATLSTAISGNTNPNQDFEIEVRVDQVANLFGLSFELLYSPTTLVEPQSVDAGSFLGSDIVFISNVDKSAGQIGIGATRKAGQGGASGAGVVAQIKMHVSAQAQVGQVVTLTLQNVAAVDSAGQSIAMSVMDQSLVLDVKSKQNENMPAAFALYANVPNPFNPSTTIKYDLPRQAEVKLEIFDMLGRRVRTLVNQHQTAGRHAIAWDGRNEQGQVVASGVYIYQLRAVPSTSSGQAFTQRRRMALVR